MASLLLFFLLLSAAGGGHCHDHHGHRFPHPNPATSAAPSTPIRQACKATRFPDTCESTLSQSPSLPPNPTPSDLFLATANASAAGLQTARSMLQSILNASEKVSDVNRTNTARICLEVLSYSDRRLSAAFSRALPAGSLGDARAWASATLLYQYDCWSGLKYVNGTAQVSDAMAFLAGLVNVTSDALAMLAALQRYGPDVAQWGPPQTERDGYWADHEVSSSYAAGGTTGHLPSDSSPDFTVCKDGSCGYSTVQAAVDHAPEGATRPFVIYIKAGVYEETVRVPYEKTNLEFVGDGMGKTVITGSLNAGMVGVTTYGSATVGISGDKFRARNLTFANTAGPDAHQAVAFRSDSDLSILDTVEFLGHQDTLYAHSLRQLYRNCRISGTVDFIFGNSATVFDNCLILFLPRQLNPEHGESNTLSAHGRTDPSQSTGFVFSGCVVNGSDDYVALYRKNPAVHRAYLGRPWKEYSRTVFIDTKMEFIVRPEGWLPWDGDFALKTLFYGEFGSSGPGGNSSGRVPWSSQIPAEHLGAYSLENFIQGNEWINSSQTAAGDVRRRR
ncbi:probable pectinesterase/pectinesterase inhibitor 51 [Elaeis guineensis]|uniref:Pectinesterase n=1 Tax=Elaeis guineensis var. tenera TaxID=51953 RepID=A0A6I9QPC8_ELAGV|nr:probable pectinesterase/pectinesterase inhibitor 51 [Elaeis guineensis]